MRPVVGEVRREDVDDAAHVAGRAASVVGGVDDDAGHVAGRGVGGGGDGAVAGHLDDHETDLGDDVGGELDRAPTGRRVLAVVAGNDEAGHVFTCSLSAKVVGDVG